jgi:squalene-hopene/tetraprenyl-beta-curcumene cyclase
MSMFDHDRLIAAYEKARLDLLGERDRAGHWVGELSTSALSTATAISALTLVDRHGATDLKSGRFADEQRGSRLSDLIVRGLHWLADHQNPDGGWGDTDKSHSNIATTMLVAAAFRLTGVPADHADLMQRAEQYIRAKGGIAGVRKRYGKDKTFEVPILANCALAGMVPWRDVSALPFEAACVPQKYFRYLQLPVVSYAIPALVAVGQARYFHKKPWNPITRWMRAAAVKPSLQVLEWMQPKSGGYLEAVPLTSFVVMSIAGTGRANHPVAQRGVEFLLSSVRPDGSWPIDTNLATWNTTLAINALAGGGEDVMELSCLDWLLSCQHKDLHPFTSAAPGGWGWSDLSGAVPDADDTPGALLSLAAMVNSPSCSKEDRQRIRDAARAGVKWLLGLQNRDDGWPTFCRGWGKLPFDRSGADLTAHVLRALNAWRLEFDDEGLDAPIHRGFLYLSRKQNADGSWTPLWFGNQNHPREENPVYGTAKVLLAYRDFDRLATQPARRGLDWLKAAQNEDGGWGGGPICKTGTPARPAEKGAPDVRSSVEETALAVESLLSVAEDESMQPAITKGLEWLLRAVEENRHQENSPIGFYFAKLWYYEKLYPLSFTVSALGQAMRQLHPRPELKPATARLTNA